MLLVAWWYVFTMEPYCWQFYEDQEIPKLCIKHIKLTPYSTMNVKLAAQVLSSIAGNNLLKYGPPKAVGTAEFGSLIDMFSI